MIRTNACAPFVHLLHALPGLVHDCAPAFWLEQIELAVRNEAVYLDNLVLVRVKAGHLESKF